MICVEQDELADYTVDPPVRGNCLAACVASIFEVPLYDLRGIYDNQALTPWLAGRAPGVRWVHRDHGSMGEDNIWRREEVAVGSVMPESHLPGRFMWIATVKSLRTPHYHCVVMRGRKLVWDPHPRREDGVGAQAGMTWFELVDPGRLR